MAGATFADGPWANEITDLARAAAGALLFGVPLLYTMEVWWAGVRATPAQSLVVLALAFGVATVLNHTAGFRQTRDVRVHHATVGTPDVGGDRPRQDRWQRRRHDVDRRTRCPGDGGRQGGCLRPWGELGW